MPLVTSADVPSEFADDPIASHSAQFGLARPIGTPAGHSIPSPAGARPWNLRGAQVMGEGRGPSSITYDHERQIALGPDGRPLPATAEATANSVTNLDGDEGPSEDWQYDFHPDSPGNPV